MADYRIQREKLAQAVSLLTEFDVDAWITFVRETAHNPDPVLGLIAPVNFTWQSALIVTRGGRKVAIVGRYDTETVRRMGNFDEVIGYDQSIAPALLGVLDLVKPRQIALNYSESDSAADGLSHGMYLTLTRYLSGASYQLISAERLINALRGRKSSDEVARIRQAVKTTEAVIEGITSLLKPGLSELAIAQEIQADFARRGVGPAWEADHCPIVNCGAESSVGHVGPSAHTILQLDNLVHIDLGVVENEYVSDMQRLWYVVPKGGSVPEPVQTAFRTVRKAIEAAAKTLKPGARGYEVDAAARQAISSAGYPEYQHALGHHIGRTAHDGGTLLGPRWERYGTAPEGVVEAGNVYTLEPSIVLQGYGMIALEEDVLVTEHGLEWLGAPQTEIIVVES